MGLVKDKKNILKFLGKEMKETSQNALDDFSTVKYGTFSNAWLIAITVSIKDYQELVASDKRADVIRIIQAFSYSIMGVGRDSPNFIDAYFNGGKVVLILNGGSKQKASEAYQTIIDINSIANHLLPNLIKQSNIDIDFKAGVGAWLSKNNSVIRYGYGKSISHPLFTTIGESITYSEIIAERANQDGHPEILYNKSLSSNMLGEGRTASDKWGEFQFEEDSEEVLGYGVRWETYTK